MRALRCTPLECVPNTSRAHNRCDGNDRNLDRFGTLGLNNRALSASGGHASTNPIQDFLRRPTGLLLREGGFVLIGEQVGGAVDESTNVLATHERQLLGRVGCETDAPFTTLGSVAKHGLRVVRRYHDKIEIPDTILDRSEFDFAGFTHRPWIERSNLIAC